MPIFEGDEAIRQAEEELTHRWTKYRCGDTVEVISGNTMFGETLTVKFPYYFFIDGEQSYVVNETPYPFKESELKFIKQEIKWKKEW